MSRAFIAVVLCSLGPAPVSASSWDEPWHEEVVRSAAAFGKFRVLSVRGTFAVEVQTLELLAGDRLPKKLLVRGTGATGHGSSFEESAVYYMFLEKEEWRMMGDEEPLVRWSVSTPTAAHAWVENGRVWATYRHSYHQVVIDEDLYRRTQRAIFHYLHGKPYDKRFTRKLITDRLHAYPQLPPGPEHPSGALATVFFEQHAALECFYYFGTADDYQLVEPFLGAKHMQVQASAVRALSRIDTPEARERLFTFLTASSGHPFAKAMAVRGLERLDAREYRERLKQFVKKEGSKEATGPFGGSSIMDPRIGTHFPDSVRAAVQELLDQWAKTAPNSR